MTAPSAYSRRAFLRGNCCAALSASGFISALAQLRIIGAIAGASSAGRSRAAEPGGDYKALVCVYLNGGNDTNNVIVPYDAANYADYATQRSALAVAHENLRPISPARYSDGRSYGLNTQVSELHGLFQQGRLAILANVGTLAQPTTLAQYRAGTALPRQLFAHNEQTMQWHSSVTDKPFTTGWGGRLADLVEAMNANARISMSVSLDGTNTFQIGNRVAQLNVSPGGVDRRYGTGGAAYAAEKSLFATSPANLLQAAFGNITSASYEQAEVLDTALGNAPALRTSFPPSRLAAQLAMVARLIGVAAALGLRRQIFFVRSLGWDTHGSQAEVHGPLLRETSAALAAFYAATVELGVAERVTTFSASDFGRTYNSNGTGTDHGWGGHQFILGGAVKGGDVYGQMPSLQLGGPDDPGQGRWIPTTSVDEYSATLATWFGVSATDLPVVLPNIGRFAKPHLGFMV